MTIIGLDNGIKIKSENIIKYPFYISPHSEDNFCYWRRCWCLRNDIFRFVLKEEEEKYDYKLTTENIINIRKTIGNFFKYPYWWNNADWSWKEVRWILRKDYIRLLWLERYMKKHNVEVYFYDSY